MKITLSRIFEASKALATAPGQELQDFINFVAEMSEQALRALRNGITFEDNIRCLPLTVSLRNNIDQIVSTEGKTPTRVIVTRVISTQYAQDSLLWYLNSNNQMVLRMGFTGSPSVAIDVDILVFYN